MNYLHRFFFAIYIHIYISTCEKRLHQWKRTSVQLTPIHYVCGYVQSGGKSNFSLSVDIKAGAAIIVAISTAVSSQTNSLLRFDELYESIQSFGQNFPTEFLFHVRSYWYLRLFKSLICQLNHPCKLLMIKTNISNCCVDFLVSFELSHIMLDTTLSFKVVFKDLSSFSCHIHHVVKLLPPTSSVVKTR